MSKRISLRLLKSFHIIDAEGIAIKTNVNKTKVSKTKGNYNMSKTT